MKKHIFFVSIIFLFACTSPKSSEKTKLEAKISKIDPFENLELIDVEVKKGKVKKITAREDKIESFSCTDCHDEAKKTWSLEILREDGEHDEVLDKFKHADSETMDCMTCHTLNDRDNLHLFNGKVVSFDESYKSCAQCHSHRYKDWKNGAHGKRLGRWQGIATYKNCVDCHDPHKPSSAYEKHKPVVKSRLVPAYRQNPESKH